MQPLPYQFPEHATVIYDAAQRQRKWPSATQFARLVAFAAEAELFYLSAEHRETALRLRQEERRQRREALRELFRQNGC